MNKKQRRARRDPDEQRDTIRRSQPITNMRYRGFDLDYPDVERAKAFLEDVKKFEAERQDAAS